jgi:hypothetical protein
MKIDKNNILFEVINTSKLSYEDDKNNKFLSQAFYLKESKINKFAYEKNEIPENENLNEIEDEPLNEGEILLPEDKNNTLSEEDLDKHYPTKRNEKIERRIRLNKRINDENRSKEYEENYMKDKEDKIIPQRKLRKYNIEDEENTSLSKEYKKKKINKNDDDSLNNSQRYSNKKTKTQFENIQIDFSFEGINIIQNKKDSFENEIIRNEEEEKEFSTPKRDNIELSDSQQEIKFIDEKEKIYFEEEFEIQKNIVFSVIDRDYTMEQLPIIEEEKEEMISIESKVNEFYIEGNKNDDEKAFKDVTFENIKSNSFSVINGCVEDNNNLSIKRKKDDIKKKKKIYSKEFKDIKPDSSFQNIIIVGNKEEEDKFTDKKGFGSLSIKQNDDFTFTIKPSEKSKKYESKKISDSKSSEKDKRKVKKEKEEISLELSKKEVDIEIIGEKNKEVNIEEYENIYQIENVNEIELLNEIKEDEKEEENVGEKDYKIEYVNDITLLGEKSKFANLRIEENINNDEILGNEIKENKFINLKKEENVNEDEFIGEDKFKYLRKEQNVSEIEILKEEDKEKEEEEKRKVKFEFESNINEIEILGKNKEEPELEFETDLNEIEILSKEKEEIELEFDSKMNKLIKEKEEQKLEINSELNELEILGKEKEEIELEFDSNINQIEIIGKEKKECKQELIPCKNQLQILAENKKEIKEKEGIKITKKKTMLKRNYSIDNEILEIYGYEKEEKETQTNKIEMKIERNKFAINKEEDLEKELRKSLKKDRKKILKTISKEDNFEEIKNENIIIKGTEPIKKLNLLLTKTLLKNPKLKQEEKEESMLDSIEKISEITQTNIPLLKIHKEKFSIISKENILSLSESDSFRLIEKLSSSLEKSDKSEKPKNIKIKNLENKKKIKKLEGIITPRRISPEKRNIILTPSLSEINFEIVNQNIKEIKESNVSEMTQTEEDIEEKYEKDKSFEIEQNEQFNISNKEIPKDIKEEIIKDKNIEIRSEEGKKIKEKDLVIYQNNDFTFEILETKADDKIIINKPDYDIENQFFEIQNIKDKNISFKDSISSESPNKIHLFQENKTIFSSNDKFSLLKEDKKHEEKILIEKPESYKNKFDLSLIRPQNINLDNLLIIPKEKEHKVLK